MAALGPPVQCLKTNGWIILTHLCWAVAAISKASSQSAVAEIPRLQGPIPATQQLRALPLQSGVMPAPGPPDRIWLFIFMFWRRQPTQAIGLCECVCVGREMGSSSKTLQVGGPDARQSPSKQSFPGPLEKQPLAPHAPPGSHSCPTVEHPLLPPRTSAPASHRAERLHTYARPLGRPWVFISN